MPLNVSVRHTSASLVPVPPRKEGNACGAHLQPLARQAWMFCPLTLLLHSATPSGSLVSDASSDSWGSVWFHSASVYP